MDGQLLMMARSRSGLLRARVEEEFSWRPGGDQGTSGKSAALKSPREVRERGTEEGREPGTRLIYSEGQNQVVNIGDSNKEDCFAYPTCESMLTNVAQCPAGINEYLENVA